MSIVKKGRLIDRNNVFDENIATISAPNSLLKTDNNGKIDTNFLKMNEIIPPGTVVAYAGTTAPSGWLLCDGAEISRTTFANLFAAIGTAHGSGDGVTTFRIPDYRGRFLRGRDGGIGRDPDRASRTAMNTGGATGDNVGSIQSQATAVNGLGISDPGHSHGTSVSRSQYDEGLGWDADVRRYDASPNQTLFTSPSTTGISIISSNSETRPINAYVNYIIKT